MNDNRPAEIKSGACPVHREPLVNWFLRGKGKPATAVCLSCEKERRVRLGWEK